MNRVGHEGRGESTWLGFFLHGVLIDFAELCAVARRPRARDALPRRSARASRRSSSCRGTASGIAAGTTTTARRSGRRRTTSARSIRSRSRGRCSRAPCRSVSPSARWTRCAPRSSPADRRLLLLLDPPFDRSAQDPGYIKGYPPGVRENGGQYTHAAVWIVMALARLGQRRRSRRTLPHAQPDQPHADACGCRSATKPSLTSSRATCTPGAPHAGRGGWSWYTGSAAWMYRAGLESMLGLRRRGDTFSIDPCIPSSWPDYEIAWRFKTTRYLIAVSNPEHLCRGVVEATVDGIRVDFAAIPLVDDGETHQVRVRLGTAGSG